MLLYDDERTNKNYGQRKRKKKLTCTIFATRISIVKTGIFISLNLFQFKIKNGSVCLMKKKDLTFKASDVLNLVFNLWVILAWWQTYSTI